MPLLTPHVPKGLIELMKDLAKEVLRDKPTNIYEFAAVHFEKLIEQRDGSLDKNYEQFTAFAAHFEGQQHFAVPASYGFICHRPKVISQLVDQTKKSKSDMMASFKAMESINEEEVLNENIYTDERYQNAVYVIQRYYRRYVSMKKKSCSTTLTATTAAIIIQRTMRRLFSNKIKLKTTSADSAKPSGTVQDDADNVSEAASYTSSSTIQMLAESQEGRENQLSGRAEVSDGGGVANIDGATEFKEQMTVSQLTPPVAEEDSEVLPTRMDKKSIDDGNEIINKIHQDEITTEQPTPALDDTSTAHIGILSTVIGSNDQQNSLHTNTVEIDSNSTRSDPTTQIKPQPDAVAVGIYPLNFPQSLGATPETLPATSPRQLDEFTIRLQDNAYAENNTAFAYQGDVHVRKFDPDNGESLKIYDRFYHDRDDPDFSDSLNESTMERDSLENDDLEADSLDSNENVVHMSGIVKREARQDDGSLYEDTDELQEEEEVEDQDVKRAVELERVPTYLYGIHPIRTTVVERKNIKNKPSTETKESEMASKSNKDIRLMEEKSAEESLESKESTSEESGVTEIENTTGAAEELEFAGNEDSIDKDLSGNGKQTNDFQKEITNTNRSIETLKDERLKVEVAEEMQLESNEVSSLKHDEALKSLDSKNAHSQVQQMDSTRIGETQPEVDRQRITTDTQHQLVGKNVDDLKESSTFSEADIAQYKKKVEIELKKEEIGTSGAKASFAPNDCGHVPSVNLTTSNQGHESTLEGTENIQDIIPPKSDSRSFNLIDEISPLTDPKEYHETQSSSYKSSSEEPTKIESKTSSDRHKHSLHVNDVQAFSDLDTSVSLDQKGEIDQSDAQTSLADVENSLPVLDNEVKNIEAMSTDEALKKSDNTGEEKKSVDLDLNITKSYTEKTLLDSTARPEPESKNSPQNLKVKSELDSEVGRLEFRNSLESLTNVVRSSSEDYLQDSVKSLEEVLKSLKSDTKSKELQNDDLTDHEAEKDSEKLSFENHLVDLKEPSPMNLESVAIKTDLAKDLPSEHEAQASTDPNESEELSPLDRQKRSLNITIIPSFSDKDSSVGSDLRGPINLQNHTTGSLNIEKKPSASGNKAEKSQVIAKDVSSTKTIQATENTEAIDSSLTLNTTNSEKPHHDEIRLDNSANRKALSDLSAIQATDSSTSIQPENHAREVESQLKILQSLNEIQPVLQEELKLHSGASPEPLTHENEAHEDSVKDSAKSLEHILRSINLQKNITSEEVAAGTPIQTGLKKDMQSEHVLQDLTHPEESDNFNGNHKDSLNIGTVASLFDMEPSARLDQHETINLPADSDVTIDSACIGNVPSVSSNEAGKSEVILQEVDPNKTGQVAENVESIDSSLEMTRSNSGKILHQNIELENSVESHNLPDIPSKSTSVFSTLTQPERHDHEVESQLTELQGLNDIQPNFEEQLKVGANQPELGDISEPLTHDNKDNVEVHETKIGDSIPEAQVLSEDLLKDSAKSLEHILKSIKNDSITVDLKKTDQMAPRKTDQAAENKESFDSGLDMTRTNSEKSLHSLSKALSDLSPRPAPDSSTIAQLEPHNQEVESQLRDLQSSNDIKTDVEEELKINAAITESDLSDSSMTHDDNNNIEGYEMKTVGSVSEAHAIHEDEAFVEDSLKDSAKSLESILKNLKINGYGDSKNKDLPKDDLTEDKAGKAANKLSLHIDPKELSQETVANSESVNIQDRLKEDTKPIKLLQDQTILEASKEINVSQSMNPSNNTKAKQNDDVQKFVVTDQSLESFTFSENEEQLMVQTVCNENPKSLDGEEVLSKPYDNAANNTLVSEETINYSDTELAGESKKMNGERSENDLESDSKTVATRLDSKASLISKDDENSGSILHEKSVEEIVHKAVKDVNKVAEAIPSLVSSYNTGSENQYKSPSIDSSDGIKKLPDKSDTKSSSINEETTLSSDESKIISDGQTETDSKISNNLEGAENIVEDIHKPIKSNVAGIQRLISSAEAKTLSELNNEPFAFDEINLNSGRSDIQTTNDMETISTTSLTNVENEEQTRPILLDVVSLESAKGTRAIIESRNETLSENPVKEEVNTNESKKTLVEVVKPFEIDTKTSTTPYASTASATPEVEEVITQSSAIAENGKQMQYHNPSIESLQPLTKAVEVSELSDESCLGSSGNADVINKAPHSHAERHTIPLTPTVLTTSESVSASKLVEPLSEFESAEHNHLINEITTKDDKDTKVLPQDPNTLGVVTGIHSSRVIQDLKNVAILDFNDNSAIEEQEESNLNSNVSQEVAANKDDNLRDDEKSEVLLESSMDLKVLQNENDLETEKIIDEGRLDTIVVGETKPSLEIDNGSNKNLTIGIAEEQDSIDKLEHEVKGNNESETKSTFPHQLSKALSFPVYKTHPKTKDPIERSRNVIEENKINALNEDIEEPKIVKESTSSIVESDPNSQYNIEDEDFFGKTVKCEKLVDTEILQTTRSDPSSIIRQFSSGEIWSRLPKVDEETKDEEDAFEKGDLIASDNPSEHFSQINKVLEGLELQQIKEESEEQSRLQEENIDIVSEPYSTGQFIPNTDSEKQPLEANETNIDQGDSKLLNAKSEPEKTRKEDEMVNLDEEEGRKLESSSRKASTEKISNLGDTKASAIEVVASLEIKEGNIVALEMEQEVVDSGNKALAILSVENEIKIETRLPKNIDDPRDTKDGSGDTEFTNLRLNETYSTKTKTDKQQPLIEVETDLKSESISEPNLEAKFSGAFGETTENENELKMASKNAIPDPLDTQRKETSDEEQVKNVVQLGNENSIQNESASVTSFNSVHKETDELNGEKLVPHGIVSAEGRTSNKLATSSVVIDEDIEIEKLSSGELNATHEEINKLDNIEIPLLSEVRCDLEINTAEHITNDEKSLGDTANLDEITETEPELLVGSESLQTHETTCEESRKTSADFSSIGQDLDFFEYTIDYLKNSTVQLATMDDLFAAKTDGKNSEADQSDKHVENQAAVIIQSAIRGYQVRKALNKKHIVSELSEKNEVSEKEKLEKELKSLVVEETQNKPCSEEVLNRAAVIIQSAIRGYQVRKASDKEAKQSGLNSDIDAKKVEVGNNGIEDESDGNQEPGVLIHQEKRLSHPIVVVHLAEDLLEEDEEFNGQMDRKPELNEPKQLREEKDVAEVLEQEDTSAEILIHRDKTNKDTGLNSENGLIIDASYDKLATEDCSKQAHPNVDQNLFNPIEEHHQEGSLIKEEKLVEDSVKIGKRGSSDQIRANQTRHFTTSGTTRKSVEHGHSKTPSSADPLRRQNLPKTKKNQLGKKGRSLSMHQESKIPTVFDLEAIKKELLSKKVKTPPQSDGKKSRSRDHRIKATKSSTDDQNGLKNQNKSQSNLDKALKVDKVSAEEKNSALDRDNTSSEKYFSKKSVAETSGPIGRSNSDDKAIEEIEVLKIDEMQLLEEPTKTKSNYEGKVDNQTKKTTDLLEEENLSYIDQNKSATLIQKTFRGYRTRRSISASGKKSKKQLNYSSKNDKIERSSPPSTSNLSEGEPKLKEGGAQTLGIFDNLKKDVDDFKNSVVDKSATIIQKTFRGYKTRKDLSDEPKDVSKMSAKEDSKLPHKFVLNETPKADLEEALNRIVDSSEEQDPLTKVQEHIIVNLDDNIKDEGSRLPGILTKRLSTDTKCHVKTIKNDKTAPHNDIPVTYDSFDVEGYQSAALDRSATKIQKTFRGYKTRKDLRPNVPTKINEGMPDEAIKEGLKKTPVLDKGENSNQKKSNLNFLVDNSENLVEKAESEKMLVKCAEHIQKSIKSEETFEHSEVIISDHKGLEKSNRLESEDKKETNMNQNQSENKTESKETAADPEKQKSLNESATTIQRTYKGYKTRKDFRTLHPKYQAHLDNETVSEEQETRNSATNKDSKTGSTPLKSQIETDFDTQVEFSSTNLDKTTKPKDVTQPEIEFIEKNVDGLASIENTIRPVSAGPLLEAAVSTIQKAYRDYHSRKDMPSSIAPIKSYSHGSKRDNALKEAAENSDESSIFIGADTSFDLSDTESFDIKSDLKSTDSPLTPVNDAEKHDEIPPKVSTSSTLAMTINSEYQNLENDSANPIETLNENALFIPQAITRKRSIMEPIAPPLEDILQAFETSTVDQKPQWYVGDELIVPSDGSNTPTAPSSFPIPLVSSSSFEQSNAIDARVEYLSSDLQLIPSSINSAVVSTSSLLLDNDTEMHDEIIPKQFSNHSRPVSANEEDSKFEETLTNNKQVQKSEKVDKNEDKVEEIKNDITQDSAAFSPEIEDTLKFTDTDPFSPRVGVEDVSGKEDTAVTDLCKDCADGIHQTDIALLGHKCNQEDSNESNKIQVSGNVEDRKDAADSSENHFDEIKHFVLAEEQNSNVGDPKNKESEQIAEMNGNKMFSEQNVGDHMSNDQRDDEKIEHLVTIEVNGQEHKEIVKSYTATPSVSFIPPSSEDETSDKESTHAVECSQNEDGGVAELIEEGQKGEHVILTSQNEEENKSSDDKSEETSKSCQHFNDITMPRVNKEASQRKENDNEFQIGPIDIVEENLSVNKNEETDGKKNEAEISLIDHKIVSEKTKEEQTTAATDKRDVQSEVSKTVDDDSNVRPIVKDKTIEESACKADPVVEELVEKEKVVVNDVLPELHNVSVLSPEKHSIEEKNETEKAIEENGIIEDIIKIRSEEIQNSEVHDLDKTTSEISFDEKELTGALNIKQIEDPSKLKPKQESVKDQLKFEDDFQENNEERDENITSVDCQIISTKQTSLSSELVKEEGDDRSQQNLMPEGVEIENISSINVKSTSKEESFGDCKKETAVTSQAFENPKELNLKNLGGSSEEEFDNLKSSEGKTDPNELSACEDGKGIEHEAKEQCPLKEQKSLDFVYSDNVPSEEANAEIEEKISSHDGKSPIDSTKELGNLETTLTGETQKLEFKPEETISFEEKKFSGDLAEVTNGIQKSDKDEGHVLLEVNTSSEGTSKDMTHLEKAPTEGGENFNLDVADSKSIESEPKAAQESKPNPTSLQDSLQTDTCEGPAFEIKEKSLSKSLEDKSEEHQVSKDCNQTENQDDETANLQEDLEIASKLLEAAISDTQSNIKVESYSKEKETKYPSEDSNNHKDQTELPVALETDKKEDPDSLAQKSIENHKSFAEEDKKIQEQLDKLIEDNSSLIDSTASSIQPHDLPTENCLEEVVEVPCIKKIIPPAPLSAVSDQDESELESTTTKADSSTTTQAYDETSENDVIDMPSTLPDSLEAVAEKLRENEIMVARMHQRRKSEQKMSTDSIDQPAAFGELICEPIKSMQELQKTSSIELEDEVVLKKLQGEDATRESSAQSESVVFGGSTSHSVESHDTFNETLDFKPFHRMNTISTDHSIYKPTSLLFKSVTIDDTVKYIDPEKSTEESAGSFYMDDATSEDVRKKIMAYSVSEADSDYYEPSDRTGYPHDDFNISTALDTFPSTDTDTTIVSAATKIQAGARGFLTRRRLRRASMGTKSSLTEETKTSFGNDAIGESLDRLVEEEVASRMPKVQYHRQAGVNSLPSAMGNSDETHTLHLSPTSEEVQADGNDSGDLKLAKSSAMVTSTPHGASSSLDGQRDVPHLYTSSEDDVNGSIEQENESAQLLSNLDATLAARRLTLQRGDAMRNDSTPDEDNGNGKQVHAAKSVRATTDPVLIQQRTMVELTTTSTMTISTERRHYSDEATNIKMEKMRWFAMRQNSMPVQIDSEVFRVLPKHMRKRIKSAEGEKKKRIRIPRD